MRVCTASMALACSGDSVAGVPTTPTIADELVPGVPMGWYGNSSPALTVGLDRTHRHGGAASLYMKGNGNSGTSMLYVYQIFRADAYRSKRVRWSAWVQHADLTGSDVGLFMLVDGARQTPAYDDMKSRTLTGTSDWHLISVVLDVPANGLGIQAGMIMNGAGTLRVDDARLEIVGLDVPSTNTYATPLTTSEDSAAVAVYYAQGGSAPTNLDFEGVSATPLSAVAWLGGAASPITTTDPTASLGDLDPLKQMIGSAHLVGLGEGTHGTREFFQMKHRIVEMLVRDMGFTTFAIEASTPEANDLNRYVLDGEGDPKVLLSRLYFWTWNTQEVLDMIQWMRQWNAGSPLSRRVQFLGFDMQFPGEAMDSVQAFATSLNPADSAFVALRFNCMNPYRNRGRLQADLNGAFYAEKVSASEQAACKAGLQQVYDLITADAGRYPAAASAATFALRLHDARLVQQWEGRCALPGFTQNLARDRYMAENVGWIRDQAGPNGKVVLWAHNGHIQSVEGFMGGHLRAAYGSDYVNLGFMFGTGGFNAVGLNGEGLKAWQTSFVPTNSIEAIFAGTNKPGLLLDTRTIASGGVAAAAFGGPIAMRSIGSSYNSSSESSFFGPETFPGAFDLLLYIQVTTPSRLLSFVFN
ncbi:MAG: erythromycin esterase family protein [Gemmatimonadaceae bacterium]